MKKLSFFFLAAFYFSLASPVSGGNCGLPPGGVEGIKNLEAAGAAEQGMRRNAQAIHQEIGRLKAENQKLEGQILQECERINQGMIQSLARSAREYQGKKQELLAEIRSQRKRPNQSEQAQLDGIDQDIAKVKGVARKLKAKKLDPKTCSQETYSDRSAGKMSGWTAKVAGNEAKIRELERSKQECAQKWGELQARKKGLSGEEKKTDAQKPQKRTPETVRVEFKELLDSPGNLDALEQKLKSLWLKLSDIRLSDPTHYEQYKKLYGDMKIEVDKYKWQEHDRKMAGQKQEDGVGKKSRQDAGSAGEEGPPPQCRFRSREECYASKKPLCMRYCAGLGFDGEGGGQKSKGALDQLKKEAEREGWKWSSQEQGGK